LKIITAALIIMIFWLGVNLLKLDDRKKELASEISGLESKASDIEKTNRALELYIANLNNPGFLDKEARIKLNYKSIGEQVVFFYEDKNKETIASKSEEGDYSFWQKIKNIFKRD